jgi:predicted kinase
MGARPPRIIALEGASGTGKSRAARELADQLPNALLLAEAYERLRPTPKLDAPTRPELLALERRLLREELHRWREAVEARDAGRSVVADTGFLGPVSYAWGLAQLDPSRNVAPRLRTAALRAVRNRALGMPDLTVWLGSSATTRARRTARDPSGHPASWRARHEAVGQREMWLWRERWAPLLGRRFRVLPSGGPSGLLVGRLTRWMANEGTPGPLSHAAAGALLRQALGAVPGPKARVKNGARRGPNPRP